MNKIDGSSAQVPMRNGPDARPPAPVEPAQVQAFEAAMKGPPVATRPAPVDAAQQLWLQGASLTTALTGMDRTQQRDTVWKWFREDLPESAKNRRSELRDWLMDGLSDRLLAQFPQSRGGPEQDRLALKDLLKEQAPFGKQQETLLLYVLGEIKGIEGSEYLDTLVRSELQILIPTNGLVKNMMSFTHSPDLES
ncbi:hypothetical protein JFT91_03480 [Pseudomonas sp. TH08]|uniref:YopR/YscH family type III secretion effector n=1 Tax=unclassified Pseudomonas TaxID=196821 RepID=UPI00191270D6|nr:MULTISPECIES: YopR/YscH family type III secretion effector [unclassified Pseudomonas]MBK5527076.1 hypothetical protein [Pseudomonas sp. TH06]MBK5531668.1 hypothetical protein [Pseudomonas sp. TH08]